MNARNRVVPFRSPAEVAAAVPGVVGHLRRHGVIAYPTETVYGFGGATDRAAVDALLAVKPRVRGKPILVLVSAREMVARLGLRLTGAAIAFADRFWPGPLTLVLPGGAPSIPDALRGPEGGVAVRWTPHAGVQALITAYGDAITSTSANPPGAEPAMSAGDIVPQWPAEVTDGRLLVLDGGDLAPSDASTVVDCTARAPRVIRPGAVSAGTLRQVVPDLIGDR